MKGRAPTADEKRYMNKVGELHCIACMKDDRLNSNILLHHVDGRTKPDAHYKVLPLCAPHHQHDDLDPLGRIGVHPYKARFESLYGSSNELVEEVKRIIEGMN
jgi:hypothetical protein